MNAQTTRKITAVLTMALLCGVAVADASVEIEIPGQGPGGPAYARIEVGREIQDGAWAAIVFYRLPDCVPQDFNLLLSFDPPRAVRCPLTVGGFAIWKDGPPPLSADLGAVPIWLAKWRELQGAIAGGTLTLRTCGQSVASALHPPASTQQGPTSPGSRGTSSVEIVAHGPLADGNPFSSVLQPSKDKPTRIGT